MYHKISSPPPEFKIPTKLLLFFVYQDFRGHKTTSTTISHLTTPLCTGATVVDQCHPSVTPVIDRLRTGDPARDLPQWDSYSTLLNVPSQTF